MPAEAGENDILGRKPGEILWPEWFTPEHFARYKHNARRWSALFQQVPTPDEGDFFKREWIRKRDRAAVPPLSHMKIYIGSDYAVTAGAGDYTVHVVVGIDPDGQLWLLEIWRGQSASDEWVEAYCDLVERYKPSQTAEETGQIRGAVGPFLVKRLRQRKLHVWRQSFPTKGTKGERQQSIRGMMALQGLNVASDLPGLDAFIAELLAFPGGKNDDQADALGLVGQLIDRIASGKEPVGPDKTPKGLEYLGTSDGRTVSNMTLQQQVNDFLKRQAAKRGE
jgi:predicted phage terminase large subunit-like protein